MLLRSCLVCICRAHAQSSSIPLLRINASYPVKLTLCVKACRVFARAGFVAALYEERSSRSITGSRRSRSGHCSFRTASF